MKGAVELNSSWPHMYVTGRMQPGASFLIVVGQGSTLTLVGDQTARVMDVDVIDGKSFSLELLDLTVQGFF